MDGRLANTAEGFDKLWLEQVRYVGVGAMVVGGIYTLWSMRKPSSPD